MDSKRRDTSASFQRAVVFLGIADLPQASLLVQGQVLSLQGEHDITVWCLLLSAPQAARQRGEDGSCGEACGAFAVRMSAAGRHSE